MKVAGAKGRWKQNLIGKCMRGGSAYNDASVSPVVRQTLLHWAYELNEADYLTGAQRVKTHGAAYMPKAQLAHVMTAAAAEEVNKAGTAAAADAAAAEGDEDEAEDDDGAGAQKKEAQKARKKPAKSRVTTAGAAGAKRGRETTRSATSKSAGAKSAPEARKEPPAARKEPPAARGGPPAARKDPPAARKEPPAVRNFWRTVATARRSTGGKGSDPGGAKKMQREWKAAQKAAGIVRGRTYGRWLTTLSHTHTLPRICSRTLTGCFAPPWKAGAKQPTSGLSVQYVACCSLLLLTHPRIF